MKFEIKLARIVAVALFIAVIAGTWDAWWHGVLGRESFWSPPHLLLYSSTISAVLAGIYGWRKTKNRLWRNLGIVLLLVPASAPFDEMWHQAFGVESLASPLIVWSPPHLILIGAIIASFILVLPILFKDKDAVAKRLFASLAFGGILALTNFVTSPLVPIGPYHLLGYWGEAACALVFVFILLAARKLLEGVGSATQAVTFFIVLSAIGYSHGASNVITDIPPHDHAPFWLMSFSMLAPAIFLDLAHKKLSYPILGGAVGLLSTGILYGFAHYFFQPQFQYSFENASIAIFSGLLAGIVAGLLVKQTLPSR